LIALYRWMADAYGAYAAARGCRQHSGGGNGYLGDGRNDQGQIAGAQSIKLPRYGVTSDPGVIMNGSADDPTAPHPAGAPAASASDLLEPLAFFLSKVVKYSRVGNPVVDELIGILRATARGTADEAMGRAANAIRQGCRTNLLAVLTGAAFVGWLSARRSRR
jgi:hypothetical protein